MIPVIDKILAPNNYSVFIYIWFIVFTYNGELAVLIHYMALIGNQGIVRITHCKWHLGSLVMQRPLSLLLLSMAYHFHCLWRINFKADLEKLTSRIYG